MELLREVVETFIRLAKSEIHPGAVLVASDDVFEVTKTPSVVRLGPTLSEDGPRRSLGMQIEKNKPALTYEETREPRLYHLAFNIVATTGKESYLLDLTERIARFYQQHPVITGGDHGDLALTEIVPLGGLRRVNLSNPRQASGKSLLHPQLP